MLHVIVSSSRPTYLYQLIDFPFNGYGGSVNNVSPLLASVSVSERHVYPIRWGHLEQGRKSFGPLRDKDVTQTSVGGTIQVNDRPYPDQPLPANCGTFHRGDGQFVYGEDLPAGEVTLYGDYVRAWEDQAHQSECTVTEVGDLVFQTCLHMFPRRFAEHWTGRIDQLSDSGTIGHTYLYMWDGEDLLTGPSYPAGYEGFSVGSTVYEHDRQGMERFLDDHRSSLASIFSGVREGYSVTYADNPMDDASIVAYIESRLRVIPERYVSTRSLLFPESEDDWGQLSLDCADQLKLVDRNLIFLFYDIVDLRALTDRALRVFADGSWDVSLLKRLARMGLITRSKKPRLDVDDKTIRQMFTSGKSWKTPKAAASMYLLKSYAVDSFVGDLQALAAGFRKFRDRGLTQRLHARGESFATVLGVLVHRKRVLTVQTGHYPTWFLGHVQRIIGEAKNWGVYPGLANLYDVIKYSFVANWFVDFGGFIADVDKYEDLRNYFPVDLVIQSTKDEFLVSAEQLLPDLVGVSGDVSFRHYRRWCSYELPLPTVNLRYGSGLDQTRSVQASALLVQRFAPKRR